MSRIVYGLTEEKYELYGKSRISYGIAAYEDPEEDGTATIVNAVYDIGNDKEKLSKLVSLCNELEVDTFHLSDLVEDFL